MKKPARKLVIRKETLIALTHVGLDRVVGGGLTRDVRIVSDAKLCTKDALNTASDGG